MAVPVARVGIAPALLQGEVQGESAANDDLLTVEQRAVGRDHDYVLGVELHVHGHGVEVHVVVLVVVAAGWR